MSTPASLIARHPWLNWLALIALSALALWGYGGDHPRWFAPEEREPDPNEKAYGLIRASDGMARGEYFLVLEPRDESEDLLSEASLAGLLEVRSALSGHIPGLEWLRAPLPPSETLRQSLTNQADVVGQIFSADWRTMVIPLQGFGGEPSQAIEKIRSSAASALEGSQLKFLITGRSALEQATNEALDSDRTRFMSIGYLLTLIMAIFLFRNYRAVILGMLTPGLAVFWALGFLQLIGEELNALSRSVMPIMLTMIAFTEVVHLLVHFRHLRQDGEAQPEAVYKMVQQLGLPCLLAAVTTGVGFASLMLAETQFIKDFGRACTIGVLSSFLAVILLVPAFCSSRLGTRLHLGADRDIVHRKLSGSTRFIDSVIARAPWIAAGGVLVMIALGTLAFTSLRPDHRMAWRIPISSEAYQGMARIDEKLGGFQQIHVAIVAPPAEPPETLEGLTAAVTKILADEPSVRHATVRSLPRPLSELGSQPSLPEHAPPELTRNFTVASARVTDEGLAAYQPVFDRIQGKLADLESRHQAASLTLTGIPVIQGEKLHLMITDLIKSLGAATGFIFLTMTLVYRSLRLGFLSMIPNLLPLTVSAAILVILGRGLEMAAVCSFTICLGIAVDDTIHFLSRYRLEKARARPEQGGPSHVAIRESFRSVGTALIVTTIVMVSGFATVTLSDLPSHRSFGWMACGTLATALVADLIILPALIALFRRRKRKAGAAA